MTGGTIERTTDGALGTSSGNMSKFFPARLLANEYGHPMKQVCLMLKTYKSDRAYVNRLVGSFNRFNQEDLALFIVVPANEIRMFTKFSSATITVLADEEIPVDYLAVNDFEGNHRGFINAGASKLGFWELGLCLNYFAIDSDMVFIRPFGHADFVNGDGHPFTIATEALDLKSDPFYFDRYWEHREQSHKLINQRLGVGSWQQASYHSVQVMNSAILQSLKEDFLVPAGLTYTDVLAESLWEFFWYTSWALKQESVMISRCDELVKIVHHQGHHLALRRLGVSEASLARGYLGLIVNSNWSRQYGLVDFDAPPSHAYLKSGAWADWFQLQKTAR